MYDGHIHSPYCPHGTKDSLRSYVDKAVDLGYSAMTFTEHAPLPKSFTDPVPLKDSSMAFGDVEEYIRNLQDLKKEYHNTIRVKIGFEVDFIQGFEGETKSFLQEYGPEMDDSLLSVHFLKGKNDWHCIDYSPEMFAEAIKDFGSLHHLYEEYFTALQSSLNADLGRNKPRRIGHMTLIRKFHSLYPSPKGWEATALKLLEAVKKEGCEIDYNGAGLSKPYCRESYPPYNIAKQAHEKGIPLIYGSDAHGVSALKQGYEELDSSLLKRSL
ncbi:histidinol-phosphatase HisJ [Halobacillus salinarum]|uniref:Histidinol-phosphatase n=1 Tax=Halobacillus salinarum TaxID=2932257 RepID=A0ABY4ER56_9BACI|nr:histidinol-phosphatase HisJ [Halobacillus salinarum]UOQ46139.1 histidinol-phosphatase HisJ [Halobacillus salinarum]